MWHTFMDWPESINYEHVWEALICSNKLAEFVRSITLNFCFTETQETSRGEQSRRN